ncbi:DUF550 domain-containing protein [Salmonella enterica subsp. enterica serovar Stanley]|nr:DUF550 domain-containing protein [Salmonella enterica subsp. enterica serovar Stanley]
MTTITREQAQKIIDAADNVITALAGTNDDFHPDNSEKMCGLWDDLNDRYAPPEVVRELARAMLASMDAEPAGYHVIKECGKIGCSVATLEEAEKTRDFWNKKWIIRPYFYTAQPVQETGVYKDMLNIIGLLENNEWAEHCTSTVLGSLLESEITRLVGKEQQAPERERIRRKHAEWSDKTFGDVGPVGPLKHLSKEALEAAADPSDPLEWADMQFLLWDAQRRMGISDEFITRAMIEKLEINKTRQWPEPKDGEPRLHIKEQPESVVPEECPAELPYAQVKEVADLFALCWQSGEVVTYTPDPEKAIIWLNNYSGTCVQEYVKLERLQEALAGNSPVTPDGYALVPVEPTDEMIVAAMDSDDVTYNESDDTVFYVHHREIYKAMLAAAPKPETGPCTK